MAHLITQEINPGTDLDWLMDMWKNPIRRIFWLYDVPASQSRGGHRHQSGQMALQCLSGSVQVYVQTNQADQWYTLTSPNQYLLVAPQDWRLMYNFSANARLLVLAEHDFGSTSYITEPYRLNRYQETPLSSI